VRPVYIQSKDGFPLSVNCYQAWRGFSERGYDCRWISFQEMQSTDCLESEAIVFGSIGLARKGLELLGVPNPPNLDYPAELRLFLGRTVGESTLGEVRSLFMEGGHPAKFVKPRDTQKAFTGYVIERYKDLIKTAEFDDDMPVYVQDPVSFASEWRVYVLRGEVLGIGHYHGDPLEMPTPSVVRAMVQAYDSAPVAYGLDVGLSRGRTQLVEVNDAYALGSYGLHHLRYVQMIEARWDELVQR